MSAFWDDNVDATSTDDDPYSWWDWMTEKVVTEVALHRVEAEDMQEPVQAYELPEPDRAPRPLVIYPSDIPSPVLRRLVKEVAVDRRSGVNCYNRIHNRHNRGR